MRYDFEKLMIENMNPEVKPSDILNQKVADNSRGVNTGKKSCRTRHFPAAIAVMAVLLATGSIVLAATHSFWNNDVASQFEVTDDKAVMDDLGKHGFAQNPATANTQKSNITTVTDKDIQVKILQTLADEHSAYVYLEVTYGENYHVTEKWYKNKSNANIPIPDIHFSMDSGTVLSTCGDVAKVKKANRVTYEYFLISHGADDESHRQMGQIGQRMNIEIRGFDFPDKTNSDFSVRGGNWKLSWNMSHGTKKHIYHLNHTLTLGKYKCTVKDVTISPLSCTLDYEFPDGKWLGQIFAIVKDTGSDEPLKTDRNNNINVVRYIENSGGEQGIDKLTPKGMTNIPGDSIQIFLNGKEFDGMGGMGTSRHRRVLRQFNKVINLKTITGIRVAGKFISLKDCKYDILGENK